MRGPIALLLDLANISGGFLLAIGLIRPTPSIGDDLDRGADRLAPFAWIIGIVALVTAGWWLIDHLSTSRSVYHFELVGIAVGVMLLWGRLQGRPLVSGDRGGALLVSIFGLIAIIVGVQGILTPDG